MNNNRPKKGDCIKVAPFMEIRDIRNIKKLLRDKPRDYCLFVIGCNTNLRASDLIRLTVGQVKGLQPGQHFTIRECKTGKERNITLNQGVHQAITTLLATMKDAENHEPLFQSRKGKHQPLTVPYINFLVKKWARELNLKGNYGAHSLRKTFGYQHRVQFNTDIPTLMTLFNHSSQRQTLTYLGIQPSEIVDAYLKEI